MKVGSLFTGIGGFDLAAENTGFEVTYQVENDKYASNVLRHRWPDIPNLGDIHAVTTPPPIDILVGGFPCQDYSAAGKRAGLSGDRGALWWEFHRLIRQTRPTWVVGENVPGLISGRRRRDFETIIGSLTECGYGVVWATLDAQYFGVAQRRRRVFIVGHSGGVPRPEILALAQGLSGDPEPSRTEGEDIAGTLGGGSGGGSGPARLDLDNSGAFIPDFPVSALTSRIGSSGPDAADAQAGWLLGFNSAQDPEITGPVAGPLDQNARASTSVAYQPEIANALRTRDSKGPPIDVDEPSLIAFAQNQRNELREMEVAGALAAEPGMKQQTFLADKVTVRRLTPLECERLQGFPDHFTKVPNNSDTQRYRQLGNAVCVPVAQWIFDQIASVS